MSHGQDTTQTLAAIPPGDAKSPTAPPPPPPPLPPLATRETIIEARPGWVLLDFRALVEYRDLLYLLVLRDIKARYKQTVLGPLWAVLGPVISMVLFTIVFGGIAGMSSAGLPYPVFAFAALVPWALFTSSTNSAASSLVANSALIKKVFFPRLYVPFAGVTVALVDFVIASVLLVAIMFAFGFYPTWKALYVLPLILLTVVTSLGVGLWLAALMVLFRDIQRLTAYLLTAWMYLTPIVYERNTIRNPTLYALYDLNPMTAVVDGFRWCLLGVDTPPGPGALAGVTLAILALFTGMMFFNRMEKTFADVA